MPAYIVRSGDTGPVKIGHAESVADRIRALQTGHPEQLRLVRVIEGDGDIEGAFHERFKGHHIRGEWFQYVPEMASFEPSETWAAAGRKVRGVSLLAANQAFAAAVSDISIAELARVADVTPRTAENWRSGRTGPDWRSVAAMLRDDRLRSLVLKAALIAEGK